MNENEHDSETTKTTEADVMVTPALETSPEVETTPETVISHATTQEVIAHTAETETTVPEVPAAMAVAVATPLKEKIRRGVKMLARFKYTILAVVLVLLAILGLTYIMESEGRIHTGMFDKVNAFADNYKAVAKVNGVKATKHDLTVSISQLSAAAAAQGADVTDPEVQSSIKSQALDMLFNTELLKQEANKRGIAITEEDVNARLESLKTDVGGEEELQKRMEQFQVDEKSLRRDIKSELTIQTLLDQVFKEKGVTVSDKEISDFYEEAGGAKKGLPKIEEVRDQIEKQLRATKEQQVVTGYIEELRKDATIEVLI